MNCLACRGACCEEFSLPTFMLDCLPMREDTRRWFELHTEDEGNKRTLECRCTALTNEGECSIYEDRPEICRTFKAGGEACINVLQKRRTPEQYEKIREAGDPERIHG